MMVLKKVRYQHILPIYIYYISLLCIEKKIHAAQDVRGAASYRVGVVVLRRAKSLERALSREENVE